MKRKLLTLLAVLVAVCVFASSAAALPISPLAPFGGNLKYRQMCDGLYDSYMSSVGEAVDAMAAGNIRDAQYSAGQADATKAEAKADGCSWAQ